MVFNRWSLVFSVFFFRCCCYCCQVTFVSPTRVTKRSISQRRHWHHWHSVCLPIVRPIVAVCSTGGGPLVRRYDLITRARLIDSSSNGWYRDVLRGACFHFSANTTAIAIAIASVVHRRKDAELLTIILEAGNRLATRKSRRTSTEAH